MLEGRAVERPRTRAEKIRARRAREASQNEMVPLERKPRPKRGQIPRRRYDIALPVEAGAEVSLPSLPTFGAGSRVVSVLLLVLALWALLYALRAPRFRVRRVTVEGASLISEIQVRSIAHLSGNSIFEVDPAQVAQKLIERPEIAAAEVRVSWPDGVEITIQERSPVIIWDDAGRRWWLSEDGIAFLEREVRSDLIVVATQEPLLQIGQDPMAEAIPPKVIAAALALCEEICEGNSLLFDPVHGLTIEAAQGWSAFFGVEGDMHLKALLYRAMADDLVGRGIQASVVSVEDPEGPYYRLAR